jgi:hypothetical protein
VGVGIAKFVPFKLDDLMFLVEAWWFQLHMAADSLSFASFFGNGGYYCFGGFICYSKLLIHVVGDWASLN